MKGGRCVWCGGDSYELPLGVAPVPHCVTCGKTPAQAYLDNRPLKPSPDKDAPVKEMETGLLGAKVPTRERDPLKYIAARLDEIERRILAIEANAHRLEFPCE